MTPAPLLGSQVLNGTLTVEALRTKLARGEERGKKLRAEASAPRCEGWAAQIEELVPPPSLSLSLPPSLPPPFPPSLPPSFLPSLPPSRPPRLRAPARRAGRRAIG